MTSEPDNEEDAPSLIGTVLGGRYKVESLLGTGGMGAVYRAEHVHMRKAVAVKVLHREMTMFPEVVARFEREAVAAGRIEHPHVAAATDFGRLDDGSFYMVLEFVEGQSLGAMVRAQGALPEPRALRIARQIAEALAAAHAAGIVHRDLKPDNVMLVERDGRADLVKVLDFGIAKVQLGSSSEKALTQLGTIFGTPEYMAPEQAQGLEVDARADLYALGLILYEMLTGSSPFRNDELVVVLTRQITADPEPLPSTVSTATAAFVMQLLKKDPQQRPQTAAEVCDRIDALLAPAEPATSAEAAPSSATNAKPAAGAVPPGDAAHAHTALALPLAARVSLPSMLRLARRLNLERPIAIAGYAVPLGVVVASAGVLVLVAALALLLALVSGNGEGAPGARTAQEESQEPDVLALIARAENGERDAIGALGRRRPNERSLLEWRALGHGHFRTGDLKSGLAVYAEGVRTKPELASDALVLSDIRSAAEHPELSTQVLELARVSLGPHGPDLIYDIWETHKGTPQSPLAKQARALLDDEKAMPARSAALAIALRLQAAIKRPKCSEIKQLLPDALRHADERSVATLTRLTERRGCGIFSLADCYSCLRATKDLTNALGAAKGRPRPNFRGVVVPPAGTASAKGGTAPPSRPK